MGAYTELTTAGTTTRTAAGLTWTPRATATRRRSGPISAVTPAPCPANRLSFAERHRVLGVLNSAEFADHPLAEVHAPLLQREVYL